MDAYIPMEVPVATSVDGDDGRLKNGMIDDEGAFLDLATELGYPLKKLYSE